MNILIAGGTGQLGQSLTRYFLNQEHRVTILSRATQVSDHERLVYVQWDGETLGEWAELMNKVDVVINLAGRTVNCRYTPDNLRQMMDSRVYSTRVIGQAIKVASTPPRVWLQMSTATIYAHRFDAPNDEMTGVIGGDEHDTPDYWSYSVEIAKAWEREQEEAQTPGTRKVCLRSAMTMTPDRGGIFDVLYGMTKLGLGGPVGGGGQFVSWIHEHDFLGAIELLIDRDQVTGPVNLCAPHPLTQRDFMRMLRDAVGMRVGLPATRWMAEVGAWVLRTDTELLLKSRRVIPTRLIELGMAFEYPHWAQAARDLVAQRRSR